MELNSIIYKRKFDVTSSLLFSNRNQNHLDIHAATDRSKSKPNSTISTPDAVRTFPLFITALLIPEKIIPQTDARNTPLPKTTPAK